MITLVVAVHRRVFALDWGFMMVSGNRTVIGGAARSGSCDHGGADGRKLQQQKRKQAEQ